jgi:hypothetical protein
LVTTVGAAKPRELRHGDRVVLGVCAHAFVFVDPRVADPERTADAAAEAVLAMLPTHDSVVREVVLRRPETTAERTTRLAKLGVTRFRLPAQRRLFEEGMIKAIRLVGEANEIAHNMGAGVQFEITLAIVVADAATLPSLRLEDIAPYERVQIQVRGGIQSADLPETLQALEGPTGGAAAGFSENHSAAKQTLFICSVDTFEHMLEQLRGTFRSVERICQGAEDLGDDGKLTKQASKRSVPLFQRVFRAADKSGSGKIGRSEMTTALESLGVEATGGEVERLFGKYDPNGTGEIDTNAFHRMLVAMMRSAFMHCVTAVMESENIVTHSRMQGGTTALLQHYSAVEEALGSLDNSGASGAPPAT